MNTLFKKGYLLAGVIMAANMFVVNEMKAMDYSKGDNNNINQEKENPNPDASGLSMYNGFLIKYYIGRILLTLLEERFSLVLTTILNCGIISQGAILNLDVLDGDLKGF